MRTLADHLRRISRELPPDGVRDLIVVVLMVAVSVHQGRGYLDISDPLLLAVFGIVWARAGVRRVSELRRGSYVPWSITRENRCEVCAALAVGAAPWLALPILHEAARSSLVFAPVALPMWLRLSAACVAAGVALFDPSALRIRADRRQASPAVDFLGESPVLVLAMVILSASPFVAVLGCSWLIVARRHVVRQRRVRLAGASRVVAWPAEVRPAAVSQS